jgi:hypothetical protein
MTNNCTANPLPLVRYNYLHFLARIIIICFFSVGCFINTLSQVRVEISTPSLKLINDSLIIEYKILGYRPDDKFKVWLEITDTAGAIIKPKSISGDIGDSVSGDSPKKIVWDLAADSIYINIDISVEIFASGIKLPEPPLAEKKDIMTLEDNNSTEPTQKNFPAVVNEEKESYGSSVKPGSNLLLSALLPGWGLTRLSNGKPYWLIGVAGVGCIASSVYFNKIAASNLDNYLDSSDPDNFDTYYNTGQRQYNTSKALAWSAAAIWVADLGIVWIKAAKIKKSQSKSKLGSISVGSSFNYSANTHLVSFFYTF